jgi:hypothetical protein
MFTSLFRKQFPGSTQRKTPFRKAKRDSFCCLAVESLEDRTLLSTFTVLNTSDSGPDSLRQAILDANAATGTDTIAFTIAGGGAQTIAPITALPALTGPVVDRWHHPARVRRHSHC